MAKTLSAPFLQRLTMSTSTANASANTFSGLWDGLNEHLVASFFEVEKVGDTNEWQRKSDSITVKAPLIDANLEVDLQWQSPFEQAGPETKAPALFAMLQSGTLQPVVDAITGGSGTVQQKSAELMRQFEGRTGITKLNSTQVFNGMPPLKITATVLLRAWLDADTEVEQPFDQLMKWALPEEISQDATIVARAAETVRGSMEYVDALMPSKSPVKVGLTYKGRTFLPLVFESIGMPLNSPINASGKFVYLQVPVTLCSLTAIDRNDWLNTTRRPLEAAGLVSV